MMGGREEVDGGQLAGCRRGVGTGCPHDGLGLQVPATGLRGLSNGYLRSPVFDLRSSIVLILELIDGAVCGGDVGAGTEVDGLVDAAAFFEGVEVADFANFSDFWDCVVGWDGDVAGGDEFVAVVEAEGDAAFEVDAGDDEGRAFDELEFELGSAGVGAARAVGGMDVLEDDALAVGDAEFFVDLDFVLRIDGGAGPAQGTEPGWYASCQDLEAFEVSEVAEVAAIEFQEVEGVEGVAYGFAVDEDIAEVVGDGFTDGIGDGDDESPAVDAGDFVALFADE